MAYISFVREKYGESRDTSKGYLIIRRLVVEVEIYIELTDAEATLIQTNRKGDRRLATLLGPALRWEFKPLRTRLLPPSVTAYHSTASNPHHVRSPHLIAERTLASLQAVLRRLAQS